MTSRFASWAPSWFSSYHHLQWIMIGSSLMHPWSMICGSYWSCSWSMPFIRIVASPLVMVSAWSVGMMNLVKWCVSLPNRISQCSVRAIAFGSLNRDECVGSIQFVFNNYQLHSRVCELSCWVWSGRLIPRRHYARLEVTTSSVYRDNALLLQTTYRQWLHTLVCW